MNRFAAYVRAAARQRQWLLPRRRDRRLVERGGVLLHAVDTDVITLYIQPWTMAVAREGRPGYAEVFPDEEHDLVIGLGAALAEYLFYRLGGAIPLIVLPPMGEEIRTTFAAVARNAEMESDKATRSFAEIKDLIARAETLSENADYAEAARELAVHADAIARFLEGQRTAVHELRRFTQLLRDTRIAPPEYGIDRGLIGDLLLRKALEPPTDLVDRIKLHLSRDFWLEELHKTKPPDTKALNIERDAMALAHLEWINHQLTPPTPGEKPTHRVVLITGDRAIFEAANRYKPWHRSQQSFADLFLRHPKAYLAEPGLLSPSEIADSSRTQSADTPLDQWLDTWLSQLNPGGKDYAKQLEDLLDKSDAEWLEWLAPLTDSALDRLDKLRGYWADYTGNLAVNRFPDGHRLEVRAGKERDLIQRYKKLIQTDELSKAIDQRIHETWASCFSLVAENSTRLVLASPPDTPSRNPPLLTFERFPNTARFVHLVRENENLVSNNSEWDNAIKGIRDDDPSGYALFMALGVLFAARGIWRVTAIMANRALYIATHDRPPRVSGREAAYLRAVALRRCSRSVKDLAPVDELLSRAECTSREDVEKYPGLPTGSCRFMAERYALFLTYHCYNIVLNEEIPSTVPDLNSIQSAIESLLEQIKSSEEREAVINYTECILLTDWFATLFLRSLGEDVRSALDRATRYHRALKDKMVKSDKTYHQSFYTKLILEVSAFFIEQDPSKKIVLKKKALKSLTDDLIEKYSVMNYDKKLFEKIRMILSTEQ